MSSAIARAGKKLNRLLHLPKAQPDPRLTGKGANLELDRGDTRDRRRDARELLERLWILVVLAEGLGPREGRLDPAALVGGDTAGEEAGIDAEPLGEPLDRLLRRASLAALDLGDVLLGEALAREVRLGETGLDPERAQALAQSSVGEAAKAVRRVLDRAVHWGLLLGGFGATT